MGNNASAIDLIAKEKVPENTLIYQTDDETVFYCTHNSPARLYVKWKGREINANLPFDITQWYGAHGNAIYMYSKTKIYKAIFSANNSIEVYYVRDRLKDEELGCGVCKRVRNGKNYVYRLCDDLNIDGIHVDLSNDELKDLKLEAIHRGNVIFVSKNPEKTQPSLCKLRKNIIVVEMNCDSVHTHAQDSSRFVYMSCSNQNLFAIDTLNCLPPIRFDGIDIINYIAGVNNGVITVVARNGSSDLLMTDKLPKGYYEETGVLQDQFATLTDEQNSQNALKACEEIIKRNENAFKEKESALNDEVRSLRNEHLELIQAHEKALKEDHDVINQANATISELQNEIAEQTEEHEQKLTEMSEKLTELYNAKHSLSRINADLAEEAEQMRKCSADTESEKNNTIAELEKQIAELTKEKSQTKEKMEAMTHAHTVLCLQISKLTYEIERFQDVTEDDDTETGTITNDLKRLIHVLNNANLSADDPDSPPPPPSISSTSSF